MAPTVAGAPARVVVCPHTTRSSHKSSIAKHLKATSWRNHQGIYQMKTSQMLILLTLAAAFCGLSLSADAQSQKGLTTPSMQAWNYGSHMGSLSPVRGDLPNDQGGEQETREQEQPLEDTTLLKASKGKTTIADKQIGTSAGEIKMKWPKGAQAVMAQSMANTDGMLPTNSEMQLYLANFASTMAASVNSPDKQMHAAKSNLDSQAMETANAMADLEKQQAASAIDFCSSFLTNFTTDGSNKWNRLRDTIFMPMAILLLLPGAVLTQVKSIVAAGSPVIGESNPFEGIQRSIIAIFLIPGTYLVLNYSIDLNNSITFSIAQQYRQLFGTDMYRDAISFHIRAFPSRQPGENRNALDQQTAKMGALLNGTTAFAQFEGKMIENKIEDPVAGIYMAPADRADEALPSSVIAAKTMFNSTNASFMIAWNILCAFQMIYFYYLWFVGPIAAALWVWPMKQLRSAFPSWVEGVITLGFWSLFWNTSILLMACFRGVDETGTLVITALNFLATSSVKYAFDFAGLAKAAGQEVSTMADKAVQAAQQSAQKGGGGGGGGSGSSAAGGGKNAHNSGSNASHGNGHATQEGTASHPSSTSMHSNTSSHIHGGASVQGSNSGSTEHGVGAAGLMPHSSNARNMDVSGQIVHPLPPSSSSSSSSSLSSSSSSSSSSTTSFARSVDPTLGRADINAPVTSSFGQMTSLPPDFGGEDGANTFDFTAVDELPTSMSNLEEPQNSAFASTFNAVSADFSPPPLVGVQSSRSTDTAGVVGNSASLHHAHVAAVQAAATQAAATQAAASHASANAGASAPAQFAANAANHSFGGAYLRDVANNYDQSNLQFSPLSFDNGDTNLAHHYYDQSQTGVLLARDAQEQGANLSSLNIQTPLSSAPANVNSIGDSPAVYFAKDAGLAQVDHSPIYSDSALALARNSNFADVAIVTNNSAQYAPPVADIVVGNYSDGTVSFNRSASDSTNTATSAWADSNAIIPDRNVFANSVSSSTANDSSGPQLARDVQVDNYASPVVTSSVDVVPPISFGSTGMSVNDQQTIAVGGQPEPQVQLSNSESFHRISAAAVEQHYHQQDFEQVRGISNENAFQAVEAHAKASETRSELMPKTVTADTPAVVSVAAAKVMSLKSIGKNDAKMQMQSDKAVPAFFDKMRSAANQQKSIEVAPTECVEMISNASSLEQQLLSGLSRQRPLYKSALSSALGRANADAVRTMGSSELLTSALADYHALVPLIREGQILEAQVISNSAFDKVSKCNVNEPQLSSLVCAFIKLLEQQSNLVEQRTAFQNQKKALEEITTCVETGSVRDMWGA